jgi:hypothetical protein
VTAISLGTHTASRRFALARLVDSAIVARLPRTRLFTALIVARASARPRTRSRRDTVLARSLVRDATVSRLHVGAVYDEGLPSHTRP